MLEQVATAQISFAPTIPNPKYVLGLMFIAAQCFIWIAASVLTQYMFEETPVESPFLMTYVGVSLLMILFPLHWFNEKWEERNATTSVDAIQEADSFDEALHNGATDYYTIVEIMTTRSVQNAKTKKPWNHRKHALAALHIAPAMFFSDYAYNKGLKHTTVASSTVLASTSCVFVLFLSVLLRLEPFRYGKVLGVLFAIIGTAMTTWHDAAKQEDLDAETQLETNMDNNMDMVYGDMYSLLAAVGYAVYSVQALVLCPKDEELYSMTLLLGYVGVICSIPLLPMALYKMYELESMSWYALGILMIKGLLDFVVTDYLLFRAVMLTSATIANVGLGLTIPLAFAADLIFKSMAVTSLQAAGALTVLAGFILVNWMGSLDESSVHQHEATAEAEAEEKSHGKAGLVREKPGVDRLMNNDADWML